MSMWSPDAWLETWRFAADAHQGQSLPGSALPYVVHVGAVAMEVCSAITLRAQQGEPVAQPDLAVRVALLHDVLEDTATPRQVLVDRFGAAVVDGIAALSKNAKVGDKAAQMRDSLDRITAQPPEIWMVKLADRITNLQAPPHTWDPAKIARYRDEAREIHERLGSACAVLGPRLAAKIDAYGQYVAGC